MEEKLSLMSLDDSSLKTKLSLEDRAQQRIEFKGQKQQRNIESITQKDAESLEDENTVSD